MMKEMRTNTTKNSIGIAIILLSIFFMPKISLAASPGVSFFGYCLSGTCATEAQKNTNSNPQYAQYDGKTYDYQSFQKCEQPGGILGPTLDQTCVQKLQPINPNSTNSANNSAPAQVPAQQKIDTYTPLEPLPGLYDGTAANFPKFLSGLFKILIAAGAIFAVLTIVVGGIMYMTTEVTETKGAARERIMAAFYGLLLLIASVLILQTINPNLLNFTLDFSSLTGGK